MRPELTDMTEKERLQIKAQAASLERYINQYATRAVNVGEALGSKGSKMLNDLLEKVNAL